MGKIVREIKRKHGTGTATVENGKYSYDYPFAREIRDRLRTGDMQLIAERLGLAQSYVSLIMNGMKYNEGVLDFALLLIEKREELMAIEL